MSRNGTFWGVAIGAVVALALGLRCYGLEAPVLSHDEAFSWRLTNYGYAELCQRSGAAQARSAEQLQRVFF